MGFTIDMVSGEILDETSADISENTKSEKLSSNENSMDISDYGYTEQLIIVEPDSKTSSDISMPESLIHTNVDTFLDKFTDL